MKFILKTFLIYLIVTTQSLLPVARESSFLPKQLIQSTAYAEMDCADDGSCTIDISSGVDEDGDTYNESRGEEGFVGGTAMRWVNNVLLWVVGVWTALVASRCWIPGLSCGWSAGLAVTGFIAFLAAEFGSIWSHSRTLDEFKLDMNEMKECSRVIALMAETDEENGFNTSSSGTSDTSSGGDCDEAKRQYTALVKQKEAYESSSFGLWIKYIALIALEVALISATTVEIVAWKKKNLSDKAAIKLAKTEIVGCVKLSTKIPACHTPAFKAALPKCLKSLEGWTTFVATEMAEQVVSIDDIGDFVVSSALSCETKKNEVVALTTGTSSTCASLALGKCCPGVFKTAMLKKTEEAFCPTSGVKPCDYGCNVKTTTGGAGLYEPGDKHYVKADKPSSVENVFFKAFEKLADNLFPTKANAEGTCTEKEGGCGKEGEFNNQDVGSIVSSSIVMLGSGVFLAILAATEKVGDSLYRRPGPRAVFHGVSSGIVGWLIVDTHYAIDQVDAKVEKINEVILKLQNLTTPQNLEMDVSTNNLRQADNDFLGKDFDDFPSGGIPFGKGNELPCVLRGKLGDGVSGCISSKGFNQKVMGNLDLSNLRALGSDLSDMGDSLSGKNKLSKENFLKMGKIAQNAKKSKLLLNAIKQKALESLHKNGGPSPAEFNKNASKFRKKFQQNAIAALNSKGISLDKFNEEMDKRTGMDKVLGKTKKVGDSKKGSPISQGFDFNFEEEKVDDGDIDLNEIAKQNIGDLKINVDDVRESKSDNIFKVLTIRYFKSAYPVLLESQE